MGERLRTNAPSQTAVREHPALVVPQDVADPGGVRLAPVRNSSASSGRPDRLGDPRQQLGLVHQKRVQSRRPRRPACGSRARTPFVVDRRVVIERLVHRREAGVHEVSVTDGRGCRTRVPRRRCRRVRSTTTVGVAQHRVRALEHGRIAEAFGRQEGGVRPERGVGAVDPVREAAAQRGEHPRLGPAAERGIEVRARQCGVARVRRQDHVEPGVDLPHDESAESVRDPPSRRRCVRRVPDRIPDRVPVQDVADRGRSFGAASASARRSSSSAGVRGSSAARSARALRLRSRRHPPPSEPRWRDGVEPA